MQAARALYDGYNSGIHVVRKQELPKYMQQIVNFARRSEFPDDDYYTLMRLVRRAQRQTERLGTHGAPNRALRAAYKQLLQAVEENDTKAIENAIRTAVEEKSRYVAERIARTEAARAWADGFHYQYDGDAEVAAYRWKLSSRHPHFDICDMYAHANLWGLGSGIFPKDKTPILPVHPHCLCHLSPVYHSEIKNKQTNRIRAGGDEWLKSLSHMERYKVFGIQGAEKWEEHHADWRRYIRNWSAETAKSRLSITMPDDIIKSEVSIGQQLSYKDEGKDAFIPKGTVVKPKKVIAGLGSDCNLRIADKLATDYGGMAKEWQKIVGTITSDQYIFDVHWYHHKEVGNVLFKIKSYTERGK